MKETELGKLIEDAIKPVEEVKEIVYPILEEKIKKIRKNKKV